ncbi:salivary glue protein Sgs-3-like [Calliphora vicina]|uniref:salivary glue protein Sgs-3-like n=1 Tax=Calliphora vicina TaxID=7373 RepID=UPI00325B7CA9
MERKRTQPIPQKRHVKPKNVEPPKVFLPPPEARPRILQNIQIKPPAGSSPPPLIYTRRVTFADTHTLPLAVNNSTTPALTKPAPTKTTPASTNPAVTTPATTQPASTNSALMTPATTKPALPKPATTNPVLPTPVQPNIDMVTESGEKPTTSKAAMVSKQSPIGVVLTESSKKHYSEDELFAGIIIPV